MPYKRRVTGRFRGTTDEIIQWAAAKHGIDPDVMRAVAVVESYWRMTTVGDDGDSFGLYQIRRPYHCCAAYARRSTAFNADYYGAIIRAYYDGRMPWLNDVERGSRTGRATCTAAWARGSPAAGTRRRRRTTSRASRTRCGSAPGARAISEVGKGFDFLTPTPVARPRGMPSSPAWTKNTRTWGAATALPMPGIARLRVQP